MKNKPIRENYPLGNNGLKQYTRELEKYCIILERKTNGNRNN